MGPLFFCGSIPPHDAMEPSQNRDYGELSLVSQGTREGGSASSVSVHLT